MSTDAPTTVRQRDGLAVIDIVGNVDARAEAVLDAAWSTATASNPTAVVLNFGGTGYINSTGIALVVGLLAKARARGISMRAYGLSPHYREIFEITRLADFVAISPDEDAAVRGAKERTDG